MFNNVDLEAEIEDLEEILFALSNSKEELCGQPNHISHALPMEIEREQLVPRFCIPCEAEVKVLDLKEVYNKDQKKTLTGSEQRIVGSRVQMLATTTKQFVSVRVYVERSHEAIKKTHDTIGPIELEVSYQDKRTHEAHFSVDLDSVYKNDKGELIYWLDKVEVNVRNMWNLVIVLEFNDGSLRHFQSRSFRLRTKPRNYKNRSQSASSMTQIYRTSKKNKHGILKRGSGKKNNSQKQRQFNELSLSDSCLSMYTYAFDDLPNLWNNDDEIPLDRIVPSLDLDDVFSLS